MEGDLSVVAPFFSFEGGDGTGKSTQARILCGRLEVSGWTVTPVREPGGTEVGDLLRSYLKATDSYLTKETELFLFVAARSELVRAVVQPALAASRIVVADRYADSTLAYQGYGRRVPIAFVRAANAVATGKLWPDLTILLDAPPEQSLGRTGGQPMPEDGAGRRFEEAGIGFHRRVRSGYLRLAAREPRRFVVIDAMQPPERVASEVWARVAPFLNGPTVNRV